MKPPAGPGAPARRRDSRSPSAPTRPFPLLPFEATPGGSLPRRSLSLTFLFLLLAALSSDAAAQPLGLLLEGAYTNGRPTGNFQLTGLSEPYTGTATTSIDLEADLALGTRTIIPFGARFLTKRFRIEAEYFQSTLSGDAILPRDILFQAVTLPAGDHVGTTLKLRDFSGSLRFDLWAGPYSSLGIGADIDFIRYSIALADPARGLYPSDVKDIWAPVPHVALNFHDASRAFWVDAKFGYIKAQGSKAQKWRFETGYKIVEYLGVTGGWRSFSGLWFDDRSPAPDDHVQLKLEEYYAGLFISF